MRYLIFLLLLFCSISAQNKIIKINKINTVINNQSVITTDTSPPDSFDTPISSSFAAPNIDTLSWIPSEIDSLDISYIRFDFDFSEYGTNNPSSLTIPWSVASVDSDTVIAFQIYYVDDTTDVLEFTVTLFDSSGNSITMASQFCTFTVYKDSFLQVSDVEFYSNNTGIRVVFDSLNVPTIQNTWLDSLNFYIYARVYKTATSLPILEPYEDTGLFNPFTSPQSWGGIYSNKSIYSGNLWWESYFPTDSATITDNLDLRVRTSVTDTINGKEVKWYYTNYTVVSDTFTIDDIVAPTIADFETIGYNDSARFVIDINPESGAYYGVFLNNDTTLTNILSSWHSAVDLDTTILYDVVDDQTLTFYLAYKDSIPNVAFASDTALIHNKEDDIPPNPGRVTTKFDSTSLYVNYFTANFNYGGSADAKRAELSIKIGSEADFHLFKDYPDTSVANDTLELGGQPSECYNIKDDSLFFSWVIYDSSEQASTTSYDTIPKRTNYLVAKFYTDSLFTDITYFTLFMRDDSGSTPVDSILYTKSKLDSVDTDSFYVYIDSLNVIALQPDTTWISGRPVFGSYQGIEGSGFRYPPLPPPDTIPPDTAGSFAVTSPAKDSINVTISGFASDADSVRINYQGSSYPANRTAGTVLFAFTIADSGLHADTTVFYDAPKDTILYFAAWHGDASDNWTATPNQDTVAVDSTGAGGGGAGTVSYSGVSSVAHVEANTDITVTPSAGNTGDYLILGLVDDIDQALSDLDGFTLDTSITSSTSRLSVGHLIDAGASNYTFVSGSSEKSAFIIRLTKDSGTWAVQDYDADAQTNGNFYLPVVTASQDNSMHIAIFGNDDLATINDGPGTMTDIGGHTASDPVLYGWYEAVNTGNTGSQYVASDNGDFSLITIIVEAQ